MKKKIAIIAIVAVILTCGIYFGLGMKGTPNEMPVLAEGFGILESQIEVNSLYPGYTCTLPLTIINGNDRSRVFAISLEQPNPNKLQNGYEAFPEEYYRWITLTGWDGERPTIEPEVVLEAGEHHKVVVALAMPNNADGLWNKHMEVRVRVSDTTSPGLVTLAIEARWYIVIADEY